MQIDKLTGTNAFVVIDLDGAEQAAGVVRTAPKVLQGSTISFARTATYLFASRGLKISGASAGVSATPDDRDDALAAFVAELTPRVASGQLSLDAGSGIPAGALAELDQADTRDPVRSELVDGLPLDQHLAALGPVVAAEAACGSLDGRTAVVEAGPSAPRLVRELVARGATVVAYGGAKGVAHAPGGLDTTAMADGSTPDLDSLGGEVVDGADLTKVEAAVLFCGSRQGMVDGDVAMTLGAQVVVPTGVQPVSTKGLAVLRRRDIVVLPDFLTTSGPSYAGWPAGEATAEAVVADAAAGIAAAVAATGEHPEGAVLGACYAAEAFLASWQTSLPFGRPIA